MSSTVEMFVRKRQSWMRSYLLGVTIWLGAMIVRDCLPDQRGLTGLFSLMQVAGAVLWGTAVWRITQLSRQMRTDTRLGNALGDELFQANRLKAALFAFAVLSAAQALFLGILSFVPHLVSGLVVAEINLLIGCTAFVGAALYLDEKE